VGNKIPFGLSAERKAKRGRWDVIYTSWKRGVLVVVVVIFVSFFDILMQYDWVVEKWKHTRALERKKRPHPLLGLRNFPYQLKQNVSRSQDRQKRGKILFQLGVLRSQSTSTKRFEYGQDGSSYQMRDKSHWLER
jgi:hypothetical protein